MAKLKYTSYVVQESFVSENQDTEAPSFMLKKSHKAFFPFFATQFSIVRANVMHITSASRIYPIEI